MSFAQEMKQLGDEIKGGFDARVDFLGQNIVNTHRTLHNARKFIASCRTKHKAMARTLHADLAGFTSNLQDTVGSLLHKFQKQRKEIRQDLKAGHQAFQTACKAVQNKRRHFGSEIHRAKQKASKLH